ncbi:LysE family translocator [Ferrimonas sediminicola]|uniref:LysE family translocator n=1 Tax=Ferrimonas sediminicola TaxID=2569538 RepID=A0A4U1BHF6_9GAMM|nr:LysE family transporter [Ferrimonas sediminicola]TKB50484.1 LysE family translocator [Ferrimonas sediminicola]
MTASELNLLMTLATIHAIALASPGPDVALVVQSASRYGRRTGLLIALGLSVGILLHSILSLTGVSLLIRQHPLWFVIIKLAGGSYLLWLGVGALGYVLRHQGEGRSLARVEVEAGLEGPLNAFVRGLMTNLLNPKALVFFVSLFSTLVPADLSAQGKMGALVLLWALSLTWFSLLAQLLTSRTLQARLQRAALTLDGICGAVFVLVGGGILWSTLSGL